MNRELLQSELKESFAWMYRDKRKGKAYPLWKTLLFVFLYAAAFALLMHKFYMMGKALSAPLIQQDLEWLAFVLMGILSMMVVGLTNTFHAYMAFRRLKEEESLPEGIKAITNMLCAKFCGSYIMGLFYSLVFMIPGVLVHLQLTQPNLLGFIFTLCVPLLLGFLSLILSCLLAYVVFVISSRISNKNMLTVLLSVLFLAGYYILYEKSQDIFQAVLNSAADVALWIQRFAYPFYQLGLGAQGNTLSVATFCITVFLAVAIAGCLLWMLYRRALVKRKTLQN